MLNNFDYDTNVVIIGFTTKEINNSKINNSLIGTEYDLYINETNRNEQYEVLGKVSYLVSEFIKNNPNENIFIILKNTHKNNLSIYNHIYKKQFENDFTMFENNNEFIYVRNDFMK